jgi:hypothetical protein
MILLMMRVSQLKYPEALTTEVTDSKVTLSYVHAAAVPYDHFGGGPVRLETRDWYFKEVVSVLTAYKSFAWNMTQDGVADTVEASQLHHRSYP